MVVVRETALIDGVTIWGGCADAHYTFDDPDRAWKGAGIFCYAGGLALSNTRVVSNIAKGPQGSWAGGLWLGGDARPVIFRCSFEENSAAAGGAIFHGAPTVLDTEFTGNAAGGNGGAVWVGVAESVIEGCSFRENAAAHHGGAIYEFDVSGSIDVRNCVFEGNAAGRLGGALHVDESSARVEFCTFVGNRAEGGGAIASLLPGDHPVYRLDVISSILWGNTSSEGDVLSGQVRGHFLPDHSCIQGWDGSLPGEGTFDADPLFRDPAAGDWRLLAGSPCVDAARTWNAPKLSFDIAGTARTCGTAADVGAWELCPEPSDALRLKMGGPGELRVLATSSEELAGFSFGLRISGDAGGLVFRGAVSGSALSGAVEPDYFFAQVEEGGGALRVGCAVSAQGSLIAAGFDSEIAVASLCGGPVGENGCGISFARDVGSKGSPIVLVDGFARSRDPSAEGLKLPAGVAAACFFRGDSNADGRFDIADAIRVLFWLFRDGSLSCRDAADANDDGEVDVSDVVRILVYQFGDAPPLPPPSRPLPLPGGVSEGCGPDPTPDSLDCASYPPC